MRFSRLWPYALCAAALSSLLLWPREKSLPGHLRISVVDAYALSPLPGALLVLPEYDLHAAASQSGVAVFYNVPARADPPHEALLQQDFGRLTVLCYCEGYRPYALFYAQVLPARTRTLTLYMFPSDTESGPVSMVEAPDAAWTDALLKHYAP